MLQMLSSLSPVPGWLARRGGKVSFFVLFLVVHHLRLFVCTVCMGVGAVRKVSLGTSLLAIWCSTVGHFVFYSLSLCLHKVSFQSVQILLAGAGLIHSRRKRTRRRLVGKHIDETILYFIKGKFVTKVIIQRTKDVLKRRNIKLKQSLPCNKSNFFHFLLNFTEFNSCNSLKNCWK